MSLIVRGSSLNGITADHAEKAKPEDRVEETLDFASAVKTQSKVRINKIASEEGMAAFKKEFYQDLMKIRFGSTVKSAAVNVSNSAFEKMKADPEYREQMLSLLERDLSDSSAPRDTSVLLTVGETLEQYRGDSWPANNDTEFWGRSRNSFFKKNCDAQEPYVEETGRLRIISDH